MKDKILRYQKYLQINRLFDEYEALFESNTADQEAKAIFSAKLTETAAIISYLMQPMKPQYHVRKSRREDLREQARLFTGRGIALAKHLQNKQMEYLMHTYLISLRQSNSFELKRLSLHIHTELLAYPDTLASFGLSAEQLAAFKAQTDNFDVAEDDTINSLSVRKAKRQQLSILLKEAYLMLKQQFDSFVQMHKETAPVFYSRYQSLRVRKPRSRERDVVINPSDISGVVNDRLSGAPVANATINLLEHSFVMITGNDGLYFLEELPSGTYTISCHAPGYAVPEVVTVEIGNNDSVVINFELEAIAATG